MTAKRPSLFAAAVAPEPKPAARRPPNREGKRVLSIYLKSEAWKQLRMLALEKDEPTQGLGRGGDQPVVREAPAQPHRLKAL
jgi:hypothetical protein